jgi:hypothetical protein
VAELDNITVVFLNSKNDYHGNVLGADYRSGRNECGEEERNMGGLAMCELHKDKIDANCPSMLIYCVVKRGEKYVLVKIVCYGLEKIWRLLAKCERWGKAFPKETFDRVWSNSGPRTRSTGTCPGVRAYQQRLRHSARSVWADAVNAEERERNLKGGKGGGGGGGGGGRGGQSVSSLSTAGTV